MSHTLLLADDSVTTHRLVELTVAEHGVRVVYAPDGEQAIERLKGEKPDIVLADIGLSKLNGYELAAQIRNTPRLARVPVLLLTGAFDTLDEQRARQSGAAGVLVKPFEPGLLIKRVKELLGLGGTDGPAASSPDRIVTPAEPPPMRPPAGPRGVGPPPPPREAHIPAPRAAWDELRARSGLSPDTAHVEGQEPGEDYFDRLDAAFDSLDAQLAGRPTQRQPARPTPTAPPVAAAAPAAPPAAAEPIAETPVYEVDRVVIDEPPPPPPPPPAPVAPVAPAPPAAPTASAGTSAVASVSARAEFPASYGETSHPRTLAPERVTMVPASHVADAFESLLAAEQGEVPHTHPPVIEISDEVIDRIAARVAEHLTEGMLIDTVSQIVGAVTERLVKEEIARIRAKADPKRQ